jgi:FkbM family methyltransferase
MALVTGATRRVRAGAQRLGLDVTRIASRPYGQDVWLDIERLSTAWGAPPGVFFDVGANVGQSASAIRAQFPEARVLSFEPHPRTYERLRGQVEGLGVETHALAFGNATRDGVLYEYRFSELNSTVENAPYAVRFGEPASTVPIRIRTVDDFCSEAGIESIDVLKIDTEGGDLQVLQGSRAMLGAHRVRFVYTEFNDVFERPGVAGGALLPICDLLYPFGFRLVATYTEQLWPDEDAFVVSNALFARPPGAASSSYGRASWPGERARPRRDSAERRPARRVRGSRRPSRAMLARTAAVALLVAVAVFVGLPEALGDRPYDPRPSRVIGHLPPTPEGDVRPVSRVPAAA